MGTEIFGLSENQVLPQAIIRIHIAAVELIETVEVILKDFPLGKTTKTAPNFLLYELTQNVPCSHTIQFDYSLDLRSKNKLRS